MEKKEVQHQVHLEATTHLLESALLRDHRRASFDHHLQGWIDDLKAAGLNDALHPIISDLQALRVHLGSREYDSSIISRLLHRLADHTATVAHLADAGLQPRIIRLSTALAHAAEWSAGRNSTPEEDLKLDSAENH